jgi:hypothetical protein
VLGVLVAIAAAAPVVIGSGGATAQATVAPPAWRLQGLVGPTGRQSAVVSISAVSRNQAWLAGFSCSVPCRTNSPRIWVQRWDGHRWSTVRIPSQFSAGRTVSRGLNLSIKALSARDVWLFGAGTVYVRGPGTQLFAWALHWNGKAWNRIVMPSWYATSGPPISPVAVGPDAFWLLSQTYPMMAMFSHRHWRTIRLGWAPWATAELSPTDVWALGNGNGTTGLLLHWDGRHWHKDAFRNAGQGFSFAPVSPTQVWVATAVHANDPNLTSYFDVQNGNWTELPAMPFPVDGSGTLATDGQGGLWLTASLGPPWPQFGYSFCHYANGSWTKQLVPTVRNGMTDIWNIVHVPGTTAEWAFGNEFVRGAKFDRGVILSYGI